MGKGSGRRHGEDSKLIRNNLSVIFDDHLFEVVDCPECCGTNIKCSVCMGHGKLINSKSGWVPFEGDEDIVAYY